ncbi:DUF4352 domain-containing protein [Turicibacter sanguinis]|uniref:DUF4352 domain-containing protein n=1 Tax=Turicibacter sanguinis TaxID=154288 RepID=UPI0006C3BB5D|nr:DUF4352 domain-containing protein [Turicibacter sanguinis]CUN11755.1 Telomeric repeat-binding factor 2 [Turicibacter sanguinis]
MIKKRLGYVGIWMALVLMTGCSIDTPSGKNEALNESVTQSTNGVVEENITSSETEQLIESTGPERKGLGDALTVQYFGVDSFELAVTDVILTDERNSYSEKEVENVALITVSGKNISNESQMLSDSYFAFYDETGTKLDSYPVSSGKYSSIEEVSPGRQATIEFAIGIKSGSSIEIELCHVGESQPFGLIKVQP